jgi:DNA helicase HerA-like ATPase
LIRSKGVGVFFVTQSPTDVPDDVLAQLGSRVQHQLRAATPNDAKALKATVNTYPTSSYDDLGKVILSLGIGEAVVTVMNERGAPTPVAWTRLRAPESLMGPASADTVGAAVQRSPLRARYDTAVDRESAREKLAARLEAGAEAARDEESGSAGRSRSRPRSSSPEDHVGYPKGTTGRRTSRSRGSDGVVQDILTSPVAREVMRTAAREIVRGVFGVGRRR